MGSGRSMNAEIVSRLETSFQHRDELADKELEQQRQLAQTFKLVSDYTDSVRLTVAGQLLDLIPLVPPDMWPPGVDTAAALNLARWLAQRDDRGAAFSLLKMVEKADPAIIQALRDAVKGVDRPGLSERLAKVRKVAASANAAPPAIER